MSRDDIYRFLEVNLGRLSEATQGALFTLTSRLRTRLIGINGVLKLGASRDTILLIAIFAIAILIILNIPASALYLSPELKTTLITSIVFFWPLLKGGYEAAFALTRLERDSRIATHRADIALELNSSRTPSDKDTLLRFEPTDADANSISAQVTKRVVLACTEGRYEPVASILALDISAIRAGSNKIRKAQLFAIRLGILTTFVGLIWCLKDTALLLNGSMPHNKADTISNIVREMTMAFGGSVAGLLAATFLMMLSGNVENRESDVLKKIEKAILSIQTYFYYATNKEPLIRSMEALGNSIKGFNKSLEEGRIEIDRAANHVTLQIRSQDDILRARQDEMAKGRDAFAELVASQTQAIAILERTLHDASERIAEDIRTWVDAQVQIAAANSLTTGVEEGKTALAEHVRAVENSLSQVNRTTIKLLEQANSTLAHTNRVQRNIHTVVIIGVVIAGTTSLGILGFLVWIIYRP